MNTHQLKELRNALSCWQDDYDCDDDKEQYDMFGAAIDAVSRLEAAERERDDLKENQTIALQLIARMERQVLGYQAEIAQRDAAAGEPFAWFVMATQGDYIEINYDAVANLEGAGLVRCRPLYTAPTAASAHDGWKLVPVEPTAKMMVAGTLVSEFQEDPAGMYRAMIAAAPSPGGKK